MLLQIGGAGGQLPQWATSLIIFGSCVLVTTLVLVAGRLVHHFADRHAGDSPLLLLLLPLLLLLLLPLPLLLLLLLPLPLLLSIFCHVLLLLLSIFCHVVLLLLLLLSIFCHVVLLTMQAPECGRAVNIAVIGLHVCIGPACSCE